MAFYRCARDRCSPCYDSTCYSSDIHTFLLVHCTCTRRCTCASVFRTSRVRVFIALVTIHRRTPSQVLPRLKLGYASEYLQTRRAEFSSLLIPFLSLSLFLFLSLSLLRFRVSSLSVPSCFRPLFSSWHGNESDLLVICATSRYFDVGTVVLLMRVRKSPPLTMQIK